MVMPGQIDRSLREALIHEMTVLRWTETGGVDEYGQQEATWEVTEFARCLVKHFAPSEDRNRQETLKQGYTVIVPPDVDVRHTDRLSWGDKTLDVETVETIYYPLVLGQNNMAHHKRIRAFEITQMGDIR